MEVPRIPSLEESSIRAGGSCHFGMHEARVSVPCQASRQGSITQKEGETHPKNILTGYNRNR